MDQKTRKSSHAGPALAKLNELIDESNTNLMEDAVGQLLRSVGENPQREGLVRTPHRFAKALKYLTSGYNTDPKEILRKALFKEPYNEMVIVKNIELFSLCEHHLLPFYGKAHVAYIPKGKIVGLSKIPRVVNCFARRLQVQERLTEQISHTINDVLKPDGVAVVIEAYHLCMMMRGVEKQSSYTITSSMLGSFHNDKKTRQEFMALVSHSRIR